LELNLFISEVSRVIRGLSSVMRGDISVLNSEMNVVNWFISIGLEGGSFVWFNFDLFDLLPLNACEYNKCWVSLGSFLGLMVTLLRCTSPERSWLLDWI